MLTKDERMTGGAVVKGPYPKVLQVSWHRGVLEAIKSVSGFYTVTDGPFRSRQLSSNEMIDGQYFRGGTSHEKRWTLLVSETECKFGIVFDA